MRITPKSLLCAFSAILIFSLNSCTATPLMSSQTTAPETTPIVEPTPTKNLPVTDNPEINQALKFGFIPEALWDDFNQTITFSEYSKMLENMISIYDDKLIPDWQEITEIAAKADQPMRRDDGMLEILYASQIMGVDQFNSTWNTTNSRIGEKVWDELSWDYPFFSDWTTKKTIQEEWNNHMVAAYFYSFGRNSLVSGKPLFDIDESIPSMRVNQPFTRAEAVQSVLRLFESTYKIIERTPTEFDKEFLVLVEARKTAILNSTTSVTVTGISYYVSNNGNDENDGLSPETSWSSLDKVNKANLSPGDGIFFERGGLWRGQLKAKKGVTYSAYGTGIKPAIYGAMEESADPAKWSLLEGTQNIWVYYKELTDVGTLVFNDGEQWAYKELPSFINGKFVLHDDNTVEFDLTKELDQNLEFFSEVDSYLQDGAPYRPGMESVQDNFGKLYLRCNEGNPGEIFKSIEILTRNNIIIPADNTIFDNLTIKYTGGHALYSVENRITVQNSEFGWIGGSIQYYDPETNDVVRFGNAIESDGNYDSFNVVSNYIYQIYDAGASNQFTDPDNKYSSLEQNIKYSGNLMEYCTYGIEIFLYTGEPDVNQHYMKNLLVDNNYILYSGYGWGSQRPDKGTPSSIQLWNYPNPSENFVIQNNILYLSKERLINNGAQPQWMPVLSGNTYVQNAYGMLGSWPWIDGTKINTYYISAENIEEILIDVLGDATGVIVPPTY